MFRGEDFGFRGGFLSDIEGHVTLEMIHNMTLATPDENRGVATPTQDFIYSSVEPRNTKRQGAANRRERRDGNRDADKMFQNHRR